MCAEGRVVPGQRVLHLLSPKAPVTFSTSGCRRLSLRRGLAALMAAGGCPRRVRGDAAPLLSSLPTLLESGAGEQLERSASCGFVHLLPGREVSWLQGSVVPGRRPLLSWCQGAPSALPWCLPKGMATSLGLSPSPSPSPARHGCPPWPLGLVALGGTWTLRDPGWA